MNKHLRRIGIVLLYILAAFSILLAFSLKWALDTWPDLRMEEIIYELQAPLEGTGNGMIGQYMLHAALPACVIFLLIVAVTVFLVKKKRRYVYRILAAVSVLVLVISLAKAWGSLHLDIYRGPLCGSGEDRNYISREEEKSDLHLSGIDGEYFCGPGERGSI